MTAVSARTSDPLPDPADARRTTHDGIKIWGAPIGDFGLFASTLIALALGFMTFFGVTFISILGLLIYNGAGHHHVTLDTSYKFIALPAGIFVLIVSLAVLLGIWLRRKLIPR
jgi:hypothetical protein